MPDPVIIRPAVAADLPALHALVERAYRGDTARRGWTHEADLLGGQRTDENALAQVLASSAETVVLALHGDKLLGCVQVSDRGGGLAYLGLLAVDPDAQTGGLGRQLVLAAEHCALSRGATAMEMTVIRQRPELVAWYSRLGYALTGEERPFPLDDARFGLPRRRDLVFVVLAKPLTRSSV